MSKPAHSNQFSLLGQRRFAPFFWTQFLGAGNDNLFKLAFTMLLTYHVNVPWLPSELAGVVIGAVFIVPFLLFSATSGQLADKYDKARIIRAVKFFEVLIMACAAWGFVTANVTVLLGCVFLMGLHSTLFGPVKFAYLPQHLSAHELTGGNGMVEMGTFVAILLGSVAGGVLVSIDSVGPYYAGAACLGVAILGRVCAAWVPASPSLEPELHINWNPLSETWRNLKLARGNIVVYRSLLGISWMWLFGSIFLTQFSTFAKDALHGEPAVASLLLVIFSVGIGVGSLLCEKLSRHQVEVGLVPLGIIGMSVFSIDLYFACSALAPPAGQGTAWSAAQFLAHTPHWRLMVDLALLALFAGLYSVPMYALIQLRSPPSHRARIIAANNILNALFMAVGLAMAAIGLKMGLSVLQIFLVTGLLNAMVALYIFLLLPEYLLRFMAFVLTRCIYRFGLTGQENIPTHGAAILVSNHVSFIDAVLLMGASPRPVVFIMDARIFKTPVLGWLFKLLKAIPITPKSQDAATYEQAFARAGEALDAGDLVCIFPEGAITKTGELGPFKAGIMKLLSRNTVPVIPMALQNLWGSFFSRIENGTAMIKPFRRGLWSPVNLVVGAPIAPEHVSPEHLHDEVKKLLAPPVASL
jgi:1-acyl-sn-glycerol-3-phosphate acyltransferase